MTAPIGSDEWCDALRRLVARDYQVEYPERDWERQRDFERALIRAAVEEARREEREACADLIRYGDLAEYPCGSTANAPCEHDIEQEVRLTGAAAILARGKGGERG